MNKLLNAGDKVAITLSFMCMVHCIVLPVILLALPAVSALLLVSDEKVHLWLVFAVIPISLFSLITAYFHHKSMGTLLIAVVGLLTLIFALMFGHDILYGKGEVVLTVMGSLLIAYGHISNLRLRRDSERNNKCGAPVQLKV